MPPIRRKNGSLMQLARRTWTTRRQIDQINLERVFVSADTRRQIDQINLERVFVSADTRRQIDQINLERVFVSAASAGLGSAAGPSR